MASWERDSGTRARETRIEAAAEESEHRALAAAAIETQDPARAELIREVGTVCPCGIDLTLSGCYRCLHARGANWVGRPDACCPFCGETIPPEGHACDSAGRHSSAGAWLNATAEPSDA